MTLLLLLAAPARAQEAALPDFSWAGYHAGEKPLPRRKGRRVSFGHLPRELAKGGVLDLPAGRFRLEQVLKITKDGTVLRGAGSRRTTLFCPRSLSDLFGYQRGWSWSGGLIAVRPAGGATTTAGHVIERAEAGATRLEVAWQERPAKGAWLELRWFNDKGKDTLLDHLYGGVIARKHMGKELQASDDVRVREWVKVEKAGRDFLVVRQPLRLDVRPEWRPTLVARPYVREVGLEGLTLEFPETSYPGHLKERGNNAIYVDGAIDCWLRDIRIVNADSGIFVNGSRYVTVTDVRLEGRTMHHCLSTSWSQDCLFTRWRIEAPHVHGTTISWSAHGNVFSHGYGRGLAMDAHRATPFENLHTAIVIDHGARVWNPFRSGGSFSRGPHAGKRNVYFNVENRFTDRTAPAPILGHAEWPRGIFLGWRGNVPLTLEPYPGLAQRVEQLNEKPEIEDLHEWQRKRRLSAR